MKIETVERQAKHSNNALQTPNQLEYAGAHELWEVENYLRAYNKSLINKISRFIRTAPKTLEFGAGIGTLAQLWKEKSGTAPDCVEIDPKLRNILQIRGFKTFENISSVSNNYDFIYTSNVLEHIRNDIESLKQINGTLTEGGLLITYVPALPWLYSELDSTVGHYRRYTKVELLKKLKSANFEIVNVQYADCLGVLALLYVRFFGYKSRNLNSEKNLKIYDRIIYPISAFLDRLGFSYVLGKNLLVVAKKAN